MASFHQFIYWHLLAVLARLRFFTRWFRYSRAVDEKILLFIVISRSENLFYNHQLQIKQEINNNGNDIFATLCIFSTCFHFRVCNKISNSNGSDKKMCKQWNEGKEFLVVMLNIGHKFDLTCDLVVYLELKSFCVIRSILFNDIHFQCRQWIDTNLIRNELISIFLTYLY